MCLLDAAGVKRQMYKTSPTLEGTSRSNGKDLCIPLKKLRVKLKDNISKMRDVLIVEAERK